MEVFGNEINAKFFNGTDYTDCVFRYDSVKTITQIESEASYQFTAGAQFLRYYCFQTGVTNNPQYITFDIAPTYSISNTNQIHTFIALGSDYYVSDTYQSPSWDWSVGGSNIHLENNDRIGAGSYIRARLSGDDLYNASFVPFDWSSPSTSSGYSYRATFSGNTPLGNSGNRWVLALGIPYISADATGANGTLPPESSGGSGDVNVTVNVDMSETNEKIEETNGLIGSILSWIGDFFVNLGNTVKGWFVPSQDFITNWVHRLIEIIEDKFAPWPVADQTIKDIVQRLLTALGEGGVQSVDFPTISIPGVPDGPFIDGRSVSLNGDGAWSGLIGTFADFVDVVCTIWVINMVCHRVKAVLVGESVVEVEGSD